MRAWSVTCTSFEPEPIVTTVWARTRGAARMKVARQIQDAYGDTRMGELLPCLLVRRKPDQDEPIRAILPALSAAYQTRECMEHAIGEWTARPGTRPYRNYYVAAATPALVPALAYGVAQGWMKESHRMNDDKNPVLMVTEEGFRALGLPVPAPEEEDHA